MTPGADSGSAYLSGVLAAWAVAQIANGVFFTLAWLLGRRERDYLSFSALSVALALATASIAWGYVVKTPEEWLRPAQLAHAGTISAVAFNLHFVLRFVDAQRGSRLIAMGYVVCLAYLVYLLLGEWWVPGSVEALPVAPFGIPLVHMRAIPSPIASSFYLVAAAAVSASAVIVFRAYRAGKREALTPFLGLVVLAFAVVNDALILVGTNTAIFYLLPHAFMLYAFGFASTLLFRYGRAAGALDQTTTDLELTTEKLRHSHAELLQVQDELVLKRELATVGELAAAIAHEVRNPLAIIMNAVAGLRRRGLGDEDRLVLLDIVDEETARLSRLVTDLLRFARPVRVERTAASLVEIAERTQSLATEHRVVVSVRDDAPRSVMADPSLLRLVFDNLVENACQAMPAGGDVHIVIRPDTQDDAFVRVEITDTGQGMPESVRSRALDPFFTTRPSGTGLGLPIVQRITEAHGGALSLASVEGRGTTVTLRLPLEHKSDLERSR